MPASIVVEIRVYRHAVSAPAGARLRPRIENLIGIPSSITLRTMQAEVEKGSDCPLARGGPGHVMETERHLMAVQQRERLLAIPGRIAKLNGMHHIVRQRLQERLETLKIARPPRRQLIEHGAESPPKPS